MKNKIIILKSALALVICAHLFSTEIAAQVPVASKPLRLTPHRISLGKRKTFNLYLPKEFEIKVATKGLRRVRFMAESPDKKNLSRICRIARTIAEALSTYSATLTRRQDILRASRLS